MPRRQSAGRSGTSVGQAGSGAYADNASRGRAGRGEVRNVDVGGAEGTRTPYLLLAKQALSQMSYSPTRNRVGAGGRQAGRRRGQNKRAGYR